FCQNRARSPGDRRTSAAPRGGAALARRARPVLAENDDMESGGADLFDRKRIRDYLAFLVGAVRRRRLLAAGVFSSIVAPVIAALGGRPRTYQGAARLPVRGNGALGARGDGPDVGAARGAAEMIRRRGNLVALVQTPDLVRHWDEHRAPAQQLIDA